MQSKKRTLERVLNWFKPMGNKGQVVNAGGAVISLFIIIAVASLVLMFTTAVNTQTYSSIRPIVANPQNANISADINATLESGFDATNTVAGFQGVIFLALLAALVIAIFIGFTGLAGGRGGGGVSF